MWNIVILEQINLRVCRINHNVEQPIPFFFGGGGTIVGHFGDYTRGLLSRGGAVSGRGVDYSRGDQCRIPYTPLRFPLYVRSPRTPLLQPLPKALTWRSLENLQVPMALWSRLSPLLLVYPPLCKAPLSSFFLFVPHASNRNFANDDFWGSSSAHEDHFCAAEGILFGPPFGHLFLTAASDLHSPSGHGDGHPMVVSDSFDLLLFRKLSLNFMIFY
jgi:hypothetical protein